MEAKISQRLLPHDKAILTPENLSHDFGPRSKLCKQCISELYEMFLAGHPRLAIWNESCGNLLGSDLLRSEKALRSVANKLGVLCDEFRPNVFLFAMQSYYAILLELLIERFPSLKNVVFAEIPFLMTDEMNGSGRPAAFERLSAMMENYDPSGAGQGTLYSGDLLMSLYQEIFPRSLRHRLGEYYTPDWLCQQVLDQVGYDGAECHRLLDPACGSGAFLLSAIRRIRTAWPSSDKGELLKFILSHVVGIDLNPLAVMTARANYLIAIHDLLPRNETWEIPVYLGDSILNMPPHEAVDREQFDVIAGNPPWIAWDNLPANYREATKPLWEHYGLFSLSGNEARHGGGKKDLSMLMLYSVADRYLKSGGRLGFVITQTMFQTKGAGDGFRRFRLGGEGEWLKVERVDDLVAMRPFGDAANWSSTVIIKKGEPTTYPVPYYKWHSIKENDGSEKMISSPFFAKPIDASRAESPWFLQSDAIDIQIDKLVGPSDYTAHLGANTGGANGVYWLEVLGKNDEGIRVRNVAQKSKARIDVVEAVIEPDLLYPLLRWGDVARYRLWPKCKPNCSNIYLLLAQDCATRSGIDAKIMREKYPRTLKYLERFTACLENRAAYKRYQNGSPFYSMYNVGSYTIAPIKVIWRRMDRQINAVVATTVDDPILGIRPLIPQETCVLIECVSLAEAHYLCAVLNSSLVNNLIQSHSVQGGKGFGTPSMLDYLNLRRFDCENHLHKELAKLSEMAHVKCSIDITDRINTLVSDMFRCKM